MLENICRKYKSSFSIFQMFAILQTEDDKGKKRCVHSFDELAAAMEDDFVRWSPKTTKLVTFL
jgi:hypothetical protein